MTTAGLSSKLIIRADGGPKIGAGHVMRCIALAQAWKKRGGEVLFAGYIESEKLTQLIGDYGFELMALDQYHAGGAEKDYFQVLIEEQLKNYKEVWVALDGYHFDIEYQRAIRKTGVKLLVIDDNAHLEQYSADIILNQNIGAKDLEYQTDPETVMLLGPEYALIREEIIARREIKHVPESAKKVLVTMGGADPAGVAVSVVNAVGKIGREDLDVVVVAGPANPHRQIIEDLALEMAFNTNVIDSTDNMAVLMHWADLAITAGGVTCWELACMRVPFCTIVIADNQESNGRLLAEAGIALNFGRFEDLDTDSTAVALSDLMNDKAKRMEMSEKGWLLVDGMGSRRVVCLMVADSFALRRFSKDDCQLLFDWVNDPLVRAGSFQAEEITWEEHVEWFRKKSNDLGCRIFIAENCLGEPVGQIRFDERNGRAVISASMASDYRGIGLGAKVIRQACIKYSFEEKPEVIQAIIKKKNIASQKAFSKAGFVTEGYMEYAGEEAVDMRFDG